MLFFNRLTDTSLMPGSFPTLFSILAEQAEQVIPVMSNCLFCNFIPSFFLFLSGTLLCPCCGVHISFADYVHLCTPAICRRHMSVATDIYPSPAGNTIIINTPSQFCTLHKGAFFIQKAIPFLQKIQSAGFPIQRAEPLPKPLTLCLFVNILTA